jgi:hypothetical protein
LYVLGHRAKKLYWEFYELEIGTREEERKYQDVSESALPAAAEEPKALIKSGDEKKTLYQENFIFGEHCLSFGHTGLKKLGNQKN